MAGKIFSAIILFKKDYSVCFVIQLLFSLSFSL